MTFLPAIILGQITTSATKTSIEPDIDGDVINDPIWKNAEPISTFYQKTPDEGDPISEKTVVKVLYSENYFFVIFPILKNRDFLGGPSFYMAERHFSHRVYHLPIGFKHIFHLVVTFVILSL